MSCSQDQPSDALRRMDLINRSARRERSSARSFRQRKGRADAGESEALDLFLRARLQPDARMIEGDARDRSQLADGAFQLVVRK